MRSPDPHSRLSDPQRRALLRLLPAVAAATRLLNAQTPGGIIGDPTAPGFELPPGPRHTPGTRLHSFQVTEDYQHNLKDARDLIDLATGFEKDLEKDDKFILSVANLKKLDEIEKLTRRIRDRMKRM
jgi:hypothetical protein